MAKYNTFDYGDGTLYGEGADPRTNNLLWRLLIKWDDFFNGEDSARIVGIEIVRGRDNLIRPNGDGWERYRPGQAIILLDNEDSRYDAFNTSSPLYPNVLPGKFVRLSVMVGSGGTEYSLMRGIIDDIQPYRSGPRKLVRIVVRDALHWLNNRVTRSGIFSSTELDNIQDNVCQQGQNWPFSEWFLFTASTTNTVPYAWFWAKNALEAIHELEDAEMGVCFHGRGGALEFISRATTHRTLTTVTQEEILRDITFPQPWEIVRNKIEIHSFPKKVVSSSVLWELNQAIPIAVNQSIGLEAIFNVQGQPCAGDGINLTLPHIFLSTDPNDAGIALTKSVSVNTTISGGIQFYVTNVDNQDGYITTTSSIQGTAIYDAYENIDIVEDSNSQAIYGVRPFVLKNRWIQTRDHARAYATYLLPNLKDAQMYPTIQIENRPALQFSKDLYVDAIDLEVDALGINSRFRIGKIEHRWLRENGQAVRTLFKLEPYFT